MIKSRIYRGVPDIDGKSAFKMARPIGMKKQRPPLHRFDCFDPEDDDVISTEEDIFINEISQKICLLSLQVSRIENRLSAFETQPNNDLRESYKLRDPPNCPPTIPIRRKKAVKKKLQRASTKTDTISERPTKKYNSFEL